MKRRLRTAVTSPSARTVRGCALFVASAMLVCAAPAAVSAQESDGGAPDLVLSLSLPRLDRAPDTSVFADTPKPDHRWAMLSTSFMIPELPQVEYRAPIDLAPDQLSRMQGQISGWLPVPASIAPLLSVRNRLANYSGRRVLKYVDPTLRGHATRLYSVGFSLSF